GRHEAPQQGRVGPLSLSRQAADKLDRARHALGAKQNEREKPYQLQEQNAGKPSGPRARRPAFGGGRPGADNQPLRNAEQDKVPGAAVPQAEDRHDKNDDPEQREVLPCPASHASEYRDGERIVEEYPDPIRERYVPALVKLDRAVSKKRRAKID